MTMKHDYTLIYDGDCPLCAAGARIAQVDKSRGRLDCVDARKDEQIVSEPRAAGLDIDSGMVLIRDGGYLQGAEAAHELVSAAPRRGLLNRTGRWLFGSAARARRSYPLFLAGRSLLLKLPGRPPIGA
jgi:predicted DCC family thiol-disulfide oxidoreductase YuxK